MELGVEGRRRDLVWIACVPHHTSPPVGVLPAAAQGRPAPVEMARLGLRRQFLLSSSAQRCVC